MLVQTHKTINNSKRENYSRNFEFLMCWQLLRPTVHTRLFFHLFITYSLFQLKLSNFFPPLWMWRANVMIWCDNMKLSYELDISSDRQPTTAVVSCNLLVMMLRTNMRMRYEIQDMRFDFLNWKTSMISKKLIFLLFGDVLVMKFNDGKYNGNGNNLAIYPIIIAWQLNNLRKQTKFEFKFILNLRMKVLNSIFVEVLIYFVTFPSAIHLYKFRINKFLLTANRSILDVSNYSFVRTEKGDFFITMIADQKVDYVGFQVCRH